MNTKRTTKKINRKTGQGATKKHDHWIYISSNDLKYGNTVDEDREEDEEEDSCTYLYSNKVNPTFSIKPNDDQTSGSKLGMAKIGYADNQSELDEDLSDPEPQDPLSPPDSATYDSIDTPSTIAHSPHCSRSQPETKFETSYIKRGKFKGFHDDRRYRCLYGNFDETSRCNKETCYCLHASIYESPLRMIQSVDSSSELESIDSDDHKSTDPLPESLSTVPSLSFNNKSDEPKSSRKTTRSQSKNSKLSPGFVRNSTRSSSPYRPDRNSRVLSKVRQKFDYSHGPISPETLVNGNSTGSNEKLSKRVKMYHSVNNLSKKSSLRQHFAGESNHSMKDYPFLLERPQTAKSNNRQRYLRSFRLHRDVAMVNSTQRHQHQHSPSNTAAALV